MKYREVGFREVYHQFCAFEMDPRIQIIMKDFPDINKADHFIGYGYYDSECGMTIELICGCSKREGGYTVFDTSLSTRAMVRINSLMDMEFDVINVGIDALQKVYAQKIDILKNYDASDEIMEQLRDLSVLDKFRHEVYIDDYLVDFHGDGMKKEGCWVRVTGSDVTTLQGTLLNEPYQDFGVYKGETIAFKLQLGADGLPEMRFDKNFSNPSPSGK